MLKNRLVGVTVSAFAALSLIPAAASAQTGGIAPGDDTAGSASSGVDPTYYPYIFGARDLSLGMAGEDVMTLNWLLRAIDPVTPTDGTFSQPTDSAVRTFQASAGLASDGVVRQETRKALAGQMRSQRASWYGPGFYGNTTACGQKLKKNMIGVAHKKLPCGTRVVFAYRGRWARATVIDRGPYIPGRKWDLTEPLARALNTIPVGTAKVKALVSP